MAKKQKRKVIVDSAPGWMITFSDMMTLMLTFFVLLVSMAVIDERRRLIVLGSIIGTFGMGEAGFDARSTENKRLNIEPGVLDNLEEYQPLTDLLWEDMQDDITFQSNKYVQILSISDEVLFAPGETRLTANGKKIIDRILPILIDIPYPLLLAGHTSTMLEEQGEEYHPDPEQLPGVLDESWQISFHRVLSLYRYLLERGMDPQGLFLESFGKYHPMYPMNTAEYRRWNRRVDIVLDKRNAQYIAHLEKWSNTVRITPDSVKYKDFLFHFNQNGDAGGGG